MAEILTPRRFILDGPRQSGKTILIWGYTHRDRNREILPCLEEIGYTCFKEAAKQAHESMKAEGIDRRRERNKLIKRIAEYARADLESATDPSKTYLFERSIHSLEFIKEFYEEEGHEITLPVWFDPLNYQRHYSSPVFLLEPFKSIDEEGRDSLENRTRWFERLQTIYRTKGYETVVVPVFSESDKAENNRQRIAFIESHLGV